MRVLGRDGWESDMVVPFVGPRGHGGSPGDVLLVCQRTFVRFESRYRVVRHTRNDGMIGIMRLYRSGLIRPRHLGGPGSFILLTVAILVLGACSVIREVPGKPSAGSGMATMDQFYHQTLQWRACDTVSDASARTPVVVECSQVKVPVDYLQPSGPTAEIAISRVKATGQRIGSVLMNPGGPGEEGTSLVALGQGTPLAKRFDRIGFDPRGVGKSTPNISCNTAHEWDAERAEPPRDNSQQGIAGTEDEDKRFVHRCTDRTGNALLGHVGTAEVVQDMDVIRAALGDDKLTYIGYSYGTRLGYTYAEKFPQRVRAMVLDGALNPNENSLTDGVRQSASFQNAFDAYSAACAKEPDCPLGTDPTQAVNRFHALLGPLWDHPVPTSDGRQLTFADAITGVQQSLYDEEGWPSLTRGLTELAGGSGDILMEHADLYDGRRKDGSYDNSQDAFLSVHCVDDPVDKSREFWDRQDAETRKVAPFLDDLHGSSQAPLNMCAFWPVPSTSGPHVLSIRGLPNTVVVSTTGDPATPYQNGVELAKELGGSLITNKGTRHTVFLSGGVPCVDDAVFAYLIDLTPPPPGLTCG